MNIDSLFIGLDAVKFPNNEIHIKKISIPKKNLFLFLALSSCELFLLNFKNDGV